MKEEAPIGNKPAFSRERIPDYWLRYTYQDEHGDEVVLEVGCSENSLYEKISDMRTQGWSILKEEIMGACWDKDGNFDGWGSIDADNFPEYL